MKDRQDTLKKIVTVAELEILFPQWSQRTIYRKMHGKGRRVGKGAGYVIYHIDDATEILGVENGRRNKDNS